MQYTLEKHLTEYAGDKENTKREVCQKLLDIYHMNKERLQKILPAIITMYPHYSEHNIGHSEAIISSIERILGEEGIKALSVADVWMILTCAYMHDIGMVLTDDEVRAAWKTEAFKKFLRDCQEYGDREIQEAAQKALLKPFWVDEKDETWPLDVKRDIILLSSEYFRRQHTERIQNHLGLTTSEAINKLFDISYYGTIPPRIERSIADICRMHGKNFEDVLQQLSYEDSLFNISFHPRFIAVLLRIGDLCDMDNGRFNLVVSATLGKLGKTNLVHYFKHQSVCSFHISPKAICVKNNIEFAQINREIEERFSYLSEEDKKEIPHRVVLEQQRWLNYLEEELKQLKLNWHTIAPEKLAINIPDLEYKILVDGKESICSTENLCFRFSREKAYELIQGYSLYNDKLVFVRELIQNSLDAIRIQFWRDIKDGKYDYALESYLENNKEKEGECIYSKLKPFDFENGEAFKRYCVQVEVQNPEAAEVVTFIIRDNGIGISEKDLLNNIIRTGYSWEMRKDYEKEINEMPRWLAPTGSFGIGLHSVFAVSDKIYIETKTTTEESKEITLTTGTKEGFVFMHTGGKQHKRGTSMTILIPKKIIEEINFYDEDNKTGEDPLEDKDLLEQYIKDKIEKLFISNLFPIKLQVSKENVTCILCENEDYKPLFNKDNRNKLIEKVRKEKFDFAFSDAGRKITLWHDESQIFYTLFFGVRKKDEGNWNYEKRMKQNQRICCKGINITKEYIEAPYPWLYIKAIDIVGEKSKKLLNAARNELTKEGKEKLKKGIKEAYYFAIKIYQELLLKVYTWEPYTDFVQKVERAVKELTLISEKEMESGEIKEEEGKELIDNFKTGIDKLLQEGVKKELDLIYAFNLVIQEYLVHEKQRMKKFWKTFCEKKEINDVKRDLKKVMPPISFLIKRYRECIKNIGSYNKESYRYRLIFKYVGRYLCYLTKYYLTVSVLKGSIRELLRELVIEFERELGIELVSELGSELGKELGNELGIELGREFGSELVLESVREFGRDLGIEFGLGLGLELGLESGRELGREFGSELEQDIDIYIEYSNKNLNNLVEGEVIKFLHVAHILYLAYITNTKNSELFKKVDELLGCYSNYNEGYDFEECNSVGDILRTDVLKYRLKAIEEDKKRILPFLEYMTPVSIRLESRKLKMDLIMPKEEVQLVKADKKSRLYYFKVHSNIRNRELVTCMPFEEYEKIIIAKLSNEESISPYDGRYDNRYYGSRNIYTEGHLLLWLGGKLGELMDRLLSGKDKLSSEIDLAQMVECIYNQEEVQNLIKYIWRHNSNKDLRSLEGLSEVRETYKRFLMEYVEAITQDVPKEG